MNGYIQSYLEAVLPKFPLEGVKGVKQHLTSEAVLANISLHLGTKDIILADVSFTFNVLPPLIKGIIHILLCLVIRPSII